jgi:hypothetical protein
MTSMLNASPKMAARPSRVSCSTWTCSGRSPPSRALFAEDLIDLSPRRAVAEHDGDRPGRLSDQFTGGRVDGELAAFDAAVE